ncbi:nuclear factor 7, ovary-like [Hyla sarda]|uniref:nuclear factor 7, ovary-like n=1 Tax=Hyla sarda TaxID=327740 RepID=UPI0024C41962|nr:nuclear factor 7, ovary-like [Hyla sarda]XP_056405200.1 nuclear factor 7, ovary-like [Hyla sarda]XP_056405201.1 nuclear factor 7, ovary-like [Hyla sarda]XP_056405202.1 nuclear factor 7, ovary-like [Hyla sarda]XP_056405203.1 nuclear factor 7, ovary-like [Hyla sarda]XP_056405204.1 nuclear factor 7, ovary-like [Hyla sarda]XP_056405206.1 nuclear factor 7, ovary-like [Hyla sarda]XP_056405207.1 nuclear factor 7, ovary-like [Hyla sarda]
MDSTGESHTEVSQQDCETTKSDAVVNPTRAENEVKEPIPDESKLSISDIRSQLCHMQMVSWRTVSNIHSNINTMQKNQALHQLNLSKNYNDCHRLLKIEEEMQLATFKKQEDLAMQRLEEKTLNLVHLMEKLQKARTVDQLEVIEDTLKTLENPEEELDIGEPPVRLRIWNEMIHMVKPIPEQIKFDPQSAHPNLVLSPDLKKVRFEPNPQTLKGSPQCFEPGLYVLGTPGFKSGRHYWEVNVGDKSSWIIGVVKESVERKGAWELNSSNGYWVLRKQDDNVYYGLGNTCEMLTYDFPPMRIGICLDLFKSHLIFYDASTTDILHQLSLCFAKETLFPFFCPGVPVREDDWCPLTICA